MCCLVRWLLPVCVVKHARHVLALSHPSGKFADWVGFLCCCSKVVRKSIARLLTVISQQQRAALREVFKGKVSRYVRIVSAGKKWPLMAAAAVQHWLQIQPVNATAPSG